MSNQIVRFEHDEAEIAFEADPNPRLRPRSRPKCDTARLPCEAWSLIWKFLEGATVDLARVVKKVHAIWWFCVYLTRGDRIDKGFFDDSTDSDDATDGADSADGATYVPNWMLTSWNHVPVVDNRRNIIGNRRVR